MIERVKKSHITSQKLSTEKSLKGVRYEKIWKESPMPLDHPENAYRVILGDFVTTEDGTGIVHTAPTFGADDAKVAKEASPEVPPLMVLDENNNKVPLVDLHGRFRREVGRLAGQYVKNEYYSEGDAPKKSVDVEIAIELKEQNAAFKVEKYLHTPTAGELISQYCIIPWTHGL